MFQLHVKKFLRTKAVVAALLITFCIGLISIYSGKLFLQKQYKAIEATANYQQQHIKRLVKFENKEFGLLLYYLKFAYVNKPLPLTALSIGQRDVNSNIQAITIRGLEAQKYDTDLQNPFYLMMGNVDLSFVILYIFPLLIITLTFNVLSEEKEGGTWRLISVQTTSPLGYLLQKVLVTALFTIAVLLMLFICSVFIIDIPVNGLLLQFAAISLLYILFWYSVVFLIISLNKNSGTNAIAMLSVWLLLTVLLPSAVNNFISIRYPVPEALSTMLKQRDGYHRKWDVPKEETLQQFAKAYPQYRNTVWQQNSFNWHWYYAMQHCGDLDAKQARDAFMQKLQQRNKASTIAGYFIPTVNLQLQYNELSQASLNNYITFLDSTTVFHEKMRHYFYPKIFAAAPVLEEDWTKHKVAYFNSPLVSVSFEGTLSFLCFIIVVGVAAIISFMRFVL